MNLDNDKTKVSRIDVIQILSKSDHEYQALELSFLTKTMVK